MFKVEAITPAIGAEVSGVSLNKDLNSDTVEKIYNALIKHQVIFFREQNLTPESLLKLAKSFGDIDPGHPVYPHVEGFQSIVLLKNDTLNFMCQWTNLIVKNNKTPFTNKLLLNQKIPIPIANGEGRYYANSQLLDDLKKNNQIVFTYQNHVNGSAEQIAGVCNEDGNVVGMMPHPERATESLINPLDNKPSSLIFESLIDAIGVKN